MSRVEAGTRGLRFAKLDRLARTLGVPVTDLVAAEEGRLRPISRPIIRRKDRWWPRPWPHPPSACSACCLAS